MDPSEAERLLGVSLQVFSCLHSKPVDRDSTEGRGGEESIDAGSVTGIRDRFVPPARIGGAIVSRGIAPATGAVQSCLLLPSPHPLAPLPRHPRTTGTARRRRLAGECRAAEGGAVQTRYSDCSCPVGGSAHLPLDPTTTTGAADPAADAAAQRHRSLENNAEHRLATLPTSRALIHRMCGLV